MPEQIPSTQPGYRPWLGLLIAVAIILLDQWTKHIAVTELAFRSPYRVTAWFDWMLTYNTGAAFSFLADAGAGSAGFWRRWQPRSVALLLSGYSGSPRQIAVWWCPWDSFWAVV